MFIAGIPVVPSSGKYKSNIKDFDSSDFFDKINFKIYDKKFNDKIYPQEMGVLIEDIEKIEGYEKYNLIETKDDEKYLRYYHLFIMCCKEVQKLSLKVQNLENILKVNK